jgi:hypothetical protein
MGDCRHLGFVLIAARDIGVVLRYCGHRAGPAGSARINPDALVETSDAFVIADERGVLFVYRIAPADLERFGSFADDEESVWMVQSQGTVFHQSGPPNDEGLGQHP